MKSGYLQNNSNARNENTEDEAYRNYCSARNYFYGAVYFALAAWAATALFGCKEPENNLFKKDEIPEVRMIESATHKALVEIISSEISFDRKQEKKDSVFRLYTFRKNSVVQAYKENMLLARGE